MPSDKQIAASRKEGGKKGQDIVGLSEAGSMYYCNVSLESVKEDIELMEVVLEGMNAEVDPAAEDRKGGARHMGKMLFSRSDDAVLIMGHLPSERIEDGHMTLKEWFEAVLGGVPAEIIYEKEDGAAAPGNLIFAKIVKDSENNIFPVKIFDDVLFRSFDFLRKKGLMADDSGDDDINYGLEW